MNEADIEQGDASDEQNRRTIKNHTLFFAI